MEGLLIQAKIQIAKKYKKWKMEKMETTKKSQEIEEKD